MPTAKNLASAPLNSVQKLEFDVPKPADSAHPIKTYGEVFPSGATIELIQQPETGSPQLHLFDGKDATINSQIEFDGRLYRPAELKNSIQQVVRFPERSVDFGSTTRLFEETLQLFSAGGFASTIALAATHFVFATWFADVLPVAPFLYVTGSRFEAALLIRLLSLVVRHPFPISEFNRRALTSLPLQLGFTFLISLLELRRSSLELLKISNRHPAWLSVQDELVDVFSAKAVYCEDAENNPFMNEIALHIHLSPLTALSNSHGQETGARNLQAKFLAYRCHNLLRAQNSQFDLPKFPSKTRMLGRVLGAPLVDAPALEAGLARLLENHEDLQGSDRWTDLRCVTLEAVLHHIHKTDSRVRVGEVTQTATAILTGRGSSQQHDPREIGNVLRNFGLAPKRYASGYAIALDSAVSRDMHRLARELGLFEGREENFQCALCTEISSGCKS